MADNPSVGLIMNDSEVVRQLMQYYITGVKPVIPVIDDAVAGQGLVVDGDTVPKSLTYGEGSGGGGGVTIFNVVKDTFVIDGNPYEVMYLNDDVNLIREAFINGVVQLHLTNNFGVKMCINCPYCYDSDDFVVAQINYPNSSINYELSLGRFIKDDYPNIHVPDELLNKYVLANLTA